MPDMSMPTVTDLAVYGDNDFTTYVSWDALKAQANDANDHLHKVWEDLESKCHCFSGNLTVSGKPQNLSSSANSLEVSGRALCCSCFEQRYVSITIRRDGNPRRTGSGDEVSDPELREYGRQTDTSHSFDSSFARNEPDPRGDYLLTPYDLYRWLYELVLEPHRDATGLIVVAGGTGSTKTTAARGLIHEHLQQLVNKPGMRAPHLVTCEDPVEKLAWIDPFEAQKRGVDYTPRQLDDDAGTLDKVLEDAKRQQPAIVYIGEVRDPAQWRTVLDFAGTGHLVITTTHAGSLVECFKTIFTSMDVKTAADRNFVADKILAVAHLRPYEKLNLAQADDWSTYKGLAPHKSERRVIIPALWRHASQAVNRLVADGLGSLLPHNPTDAARTNAMAFGRLWFIGTLLRESSTFQEYPAGVIQHCTGQLKKIATDWDLQEM